MTNPSKPSEIDTETQDAIMRPLEHDEHSNTAPGELKDITMSDPIQGKRPETFGNTSFGSNSAPSLHASSTVPSSPTISYVSAADDIPDPGSISHQSEAGLAGFSSPVPVFPFLGGIYGTSTPPDQPPSSNNNTYRQPFVHQPYGKSPYPDVVASLAPSNSDPGPIFDVPDPNEAGSNEYDLLSRIQGLYRLLELYSENATGGLVDKIIISEESLENFLHAICPGAYKSLTKIDFLALDLISVNAVGIYGSKSEIARFLREAGALDDEMWVVLLHGYLTGARKAHFLGRFARGRLLLVPDDVTSHVQPHLRSGIYALIPPRSQQYIAPGALPVIYIVYWPEETTWDDDAIGTIRKNRTTFMRYLTRLSDQVRALISPNHSAVLDWQQLDNESDSNESMDDSDESDDDFDDRFFKFEVAKTNEQEEGVVVREGFKISHHAISADAIASLSSNGANARNMANSFFVGGETCQAFIDSQYVAAEARNVSINERSCTPSYLRSLLGKYRTIYLANSVDEKGINILLEDGDLKYRAPELYRNYRDESQRVEKSQKGREAEDTRKALEEIDANHTRLVDDARKWVIALAAQTFPSLNLGDTVPDASMNEAEPQYFLNLQVMYPGVEEVVGKILKDKTNSLDTIKDAKYGAMKRRFLILQSVQKSQGALSGTRRADAINSLFFDAETTDPQPSRSTSWRDSARGYFEGLKSRLGLSAMQDTYATHRPPANQDDPEFISNLADLALQEPDYQRFSEEVCSRARVFLLERITSVTESLVKKVETAQEYAIKEQSRQLASVRALQEITDFKVKYRSLFEKALATTSAGPTLTLTSVEEQNHHFRLQGYYGHQTEAKFRHRVWALETSEEDRLRIRENQQYTPQPKVLPTPSIAFSLPLGWSIRHLQVLTNGSKKHVLLVVDRLDSIGVWLFPFSGNFSPEKPTKRIPKSSNSRYVIACDEQRRLVALVISNTDRCEAHLFVIDESFGNIQSRGSPFNLLRWYQDCDPNIVAAAFFSGSEELCLMERNGRVRVFSFIAQSFKPGTIQLGQGVYHLQTSPDGTALIAVEQGQTGKKLGVFHHASFGYNQAGINADLPQEFNTTTSFTLTSIGDRRNVFLMALSPSTRSLHSVAIDISRKETEYQFRAKAEKAQSSVSTPTIHNSLIDCFLEVWSRYPVVAAIQRETFSGSARLPLSVTFVSDEPDRPFEPYFKRMVRDFERVSKKPTEKRLDKIVIEAARFEDLEWEAPTSSTYKAGEWLAELLCLIPIHIALARENRFVPLKDGILDPELERQLLGAEVASIIDAITIGWYESIFSSYMATKPVKVVSSMGMYTYVFIANALTLAITYPRSLGEQSVGKSYSLNHLVDSSFAGSAVRTTEGVWLSVCPTKDALVVALDFEGVHSIERTAQEDMLLVLFNTALSNLVLFRNNFALSRDVANMFTSFQASTHLFDPASNPKLFKGLLAIVIKDVVDSDKKEIVKEFSSKFSQIVSTEQADNFITVLHDSQLTVIPWNVIQSREFYTLFSKLSKHLFKQKTTHATAGEFLITLKTLMAKLKAQDWGSIDQTVIKHRVAALTNILPNAFSTGRAEVYPVVEDLKNLDNQEPIVAADSEAEFYIGKTPRDIEIALSAHLRDWRPDAARHPVQELQEYLRGRASLRLAHVQAWFDANTSRFPTDNADIRGLRRQFDDASAALQTNIQLCLAECAECPTISRPVTTAERITTVKHLVNMSTSIRNPSVVDYRLDTKVVTYAKGLRTCAVNSARLTPRRAVSACVQNPLTTRTMNTFAQLERTSAGGRAISKASPHRTVRFIIVPVYALFLTTWPMKNIAARTGCLVPSSANSVDTTARLGIISTASQTAHSISAGKGTTVATSRHDSFQYTKYTQVARRLSCAVRIAAGERRHAGLHVHSTEADPFHYCEQKCINCGYFCHLPLGHPQAEHDTAHGSMEYTAWAIEGAADVTIEVQGRKFGAQDNGAPQLCSAVCRNLGRHAHIDYCRNGKERCQEPESEHINERMLPNADRAKDWVSHRIFWARSGFRDPYSNVEQGEFSLCDVQCAGEEHNATANLPARPSYCTLPIFHPPQPTNWQVAGDASYISADGHSFACPNPNNLRQAYHVLFVLDKSGSMTYSDRVPLPNQPVTQLITTNNNNRFGAVLSSLYGFWISRGSGATGGRRDAYSVITFDSYSQVQIENDFDGDAEQLLQHIVGISAGGGTNFDGALQTVQAVMENNWSTDRSPVVIFLSDGECGVRDDIIYDLCNRAVALGKPLSLHSVAFGTDSASLRRMVSLADQVAQAAPRDPLSPLVPCDYTDAMDTIRLAETFLQIADSLKKPRASLISV
ncbi:hypothetical protein FRB99_005823 [Tulasnella sp. 403]|nr:hypothetical protein FRB99_005823 [Tulasnella sp. 403]